jgi:hypothetical protein
MGKKKENPNQLRMFMTPREIKTGYFPNLPDKDEFYDADLGDYRTETDEELWDRKLNESIDYGLLDSVAKHGVEVPVSIDPRTRQIRGGHHRIAAANHINPDQFIPVMYNKDVWQAGRAESEIMSLPETSAERKEMGYDNWL